MGFHDSFRKEKAGGELFVVTGCAHRGRDRFTRDANLERFFDGEIVPMIFERAVLLSPDDLSRADAVFFH